MHRKLKIVTGGWGGGKWELCGRREMGERAFSLFIFFYIFYFELCECQTGREGGRAQPLKEWHSGWGQKLVRTNSSKMLEGLTFSGLWTLLCTPVLLPGKFHGQKSLVGYSPWGRKESDTTEQLHFTFFTHFILYHWRRKGQPTPIFWPGESHGQRAWQAMVHGVAESRTRRRHSL